MPLPELRGRQKEVLCLPAEGHHVVLGTAGSGKTTLAILRSAYLSDPSRDQSGKTLLVTFNKSLVTYIRYLREGKARNVVAENYHKFARGYLASRGKMSYNCICDGDEQSDLVQEAIKEVAKTHEPHPFFGLPVAVFCDEIRWMAQHGIDALKDYEAAKRVGRSSVRLVRDNREPMSMIQKAYKANRTRAGKMYDWDDLASAVRAEFDSDGTKRRYQHIVIDEGQDFSPEMIRSLAGAIPPGGSITLFGDVAQQIYGRRISWRSAGLKIKKVWKFRENYRNTTQIAKLGLAVSKMPYFKGVPDIVEPLSPTADGPPPTLVECKSTEKEIELVATQANQASKTMSVVILFRNWSDQRLLLPRLPRGSRRLHGDMSRWQSGPGTYYGTYHAAKGLEFEMVILPFCCEGRLPDPEKVAVFGKEDAMIEDGRLFYVGVTRARSRLIMTFSGQLTHLMPKAKGLYRMLTA